MEIDSTRREPPYAICPRLTRGQQIDITYWSPKYAKYSETSSVYYLCELSGAAAGLYTIHIQYMYVETKTTHIHTKWVFSRNYSTQLFLTRHAIYKVHG